MPTNPWYSKVNVTALGDDARRLILERVKHKLGFTKTLEALGIAKGSLYNYLHGVRRVPDNVVYRALQHLGESEFNEIVKGLDRLRAIGIIRVDGSIDYSLILQAIALATRDEYLKQALLKFTVENFREDLREMLGSSLARVVFKWERLEPLNPADLPVAKIKVAIPMLQRHFVEPVDDATPVSVEGQAQSTVKKSRRYEWVEKIIEKGLPDGRKRFILYVLSAYLVNVKGLSEEEAIQVVQEFLENSCRNHGNCGKVYESFIRGDLQRVKSKGLKPTTLEKLREKDPDLHSLIEHALS
jgi:hypothetical protein